MKKNRIQWRAFDDPHLGFLRPKRGRRAKVRSQVNPRISLPLEEIAERYEGGENLGDIARTFGVTKATVGRRLKGRGIRLRSSAESQASTAIQALGKEGLRDLYWGQRKTCKEIAERCGCSDTIVLKWMRRWGIERRPPQVPQQCLVVWKPVGGRARRVVGLLKDMGEKYHLHVSESYYIVPKRSVVSISGMAGRLSSRMGLYLEGLSDHDIARLQSVGHAAVARWRYRRGLPRNSEPLFPTSAPRIPSPHPKPEPKDPPVLSIMAHLRQGYEYAVGEGWVKRSGCLDGGCTTYECGRCGSELRVKGSMMGRITCRCGSRYFFKAREAVIRKVRAR